jgi:hypothetical protein
VRRRRRRPAQRPSPTGRPDMSRGHPLGHRTRGAGDQTDTW